MSVIILVVLTMINFAASLREFRRGYLLAIDHVERMTRPGHSLSYSLDEAITILRKETSGRK